MATPFGVLTNHFTSSVDGANDSVPFWQATSNSAFWISRNTLLNIASGPVGLTDSQTLTNKILTSPTISGPTLSGTVIGTYTLGGTPTFPSAVVTLTGSQTLTNKMFTSPAITGGTLDNATVTVDTVAGHTTANTGTVYGVSVTSGTIGSAALATSSIVTAAITDNNVTASKLATNAITLGYAQITSPVTTASTSFVDATGLTTGAITIPGGGRRVEFNIRASAINTSLQAGVWSIALLEDGTVIQQWYRNEDVAAFNFPLDVSFSKVASAGSHTYKVQFATSTGTLTIAAGTTSSTPATAGPASILVKAI